MNVCNERWWQIIEKGWRPFQGWGFAVAAVLYAMRPVFDWAFEIEVFAALAAASGAGFLTRAVEKAKERKS